jgi:benzoyl-CoA reductase/2-hydroxyglutaryl-CoA dehydratase subunit BcrC/BadD/HgdB
MVCFVKYPRDLNKRFCPYVQGFYGNVLSRGCDTVRTSSNLTIHVKHIPKQFVWRNTSQMLFFNHNFFLQKNQTV